MEMTSRYSRAGAVTRTLALSAIATGILCAGASTARADDYAYFVSANYGTTGQWDGGNHGTLDLNTGVAQQIAAFTPPCCHGTVGYLGLGEAGGALYSTTPSTNTQSSFLVRDTSPNTASDPVLVGATGHNVVDFGSTTTGLYGISGNGNLLSINATTGLATIVGSTGLSFNINSASGLSSNDSKLYVTNGSLLYSVNTVTGAATQIGETASATQTFDIQALAYEHGTLYGAGYDAATYSNYVGVVDPTTGAVTDATAISGGLPAGDFVTGMVDTTSVSMPAPVPEPAMLSLFALGFAGIGLRRRRTAK